MKRQFISNLAEVTAVVNKIKQYQSSCDVKPLICDLCKNTSVLEPIIITLNEERNRHIVILRCPCKTCKFEQHFLSEFFLYDNE